MLYYDNIDKIADIFSLDWILLTLILSAFGAICLRVCSRKFFQIVQQSSYQNYDYKKWLSRRGNIYVNRLLILALLSFFAYVLFTISFNFLFEQFMAYVAFLFYAFFLGVYVWGDKRHADKCPMVFTKRLIRLTNLTSFLYLVVCFILVTLVNLLFYFVKDNHLLVSVRFSIIILCPILVPYLVVVANSISCIFENKRNKKYVVEAKKKLDSMPNLIKIGVTGSYGKTTVKNMITTILSEKYKVYQTPYSYNTPMGICKAIKELDSTYDVFVVEMGARRRGEIKELCDFVNPSIAVLTGVTNQHLDTFKSIDTIINTKAEILQHDGVKAYVNADSQNAMIAKNLAPDTDCVITGFGDSCDVFAQNIQRLNTETTFIMNFAGKKVECKTNLLGEHSVSNILLASAVCYDLGLSLNEIAQGVKKIESPSHRLELVDNDKGIKIIDDSYNANVVGAEIAVNVAKSFGNRTIVVTPGLVELGKLEEEENKKFGQILSVCDKIILVGSTSAYSVRAGLLEAGFDFDNIIMAKTLDEAKEKLSQIVMVGDTVLFENDLPDRFL